MKNLQRGCYLLNEVLKVSLLKQMASCPCSNTRILWMWPCLENKVFASVIKLRSLCWDHLDYPGDPKSNDKCPHQRQKKRRHTKRLRKRDHRGRAWRDAPKSQGPWGATGGWKTQGRLFLEPPEGCGSKDTLSLDSWTPGLWQNQLLLCPGTSLW